MHGNSPKAAGHRALLSCKLGFACSAWSSTREQHVLAIEGSTAPFKMANAGLGEEKRDGEGCGLIFSFSHTHGVTASPCETEGAAAAPSRLLLVPAG